ncbi:MAG: response regulator [Clostridiales bacterium]|nr:response regulator [Clostridiales bacterium]
MKRRNLLVVDDSLINRKLLRRILEVDNYRIIEAENGVEAWKIIIGKENHISLILLDLTMPLMNGYELLEKMRENGIISSIPVIVTTGSEQDNAEIKSLDSGASDFITKPYNPELVRRRVSSLLRLFDNALFLNQLEIDKVTGLYSAEFFYRHAQMELDENPDKDYEIVCSNIESFRVINSKYGTDVGDSLLRYIANYNKENFGEKSICGRIGADIFAVLRTKREHHS